MMDIDALQTMHPGLPSGLPGWRVQELTGYAAIALQRRHQPGVTLLLTIGGQEVRETLSWAERSGSEMVDDDRATDAGAEGLALTIVGHHRKWRIARRLTSRRGKPEGDWLLYDPDSRQTIVLEISGTDEGPFEARVRQKRGQVALAARRGTPLVSVVRFLEPMAMLEG
jgi:hypothetical protein